MSEYYCRSLNGIIYYIHTDTGVSCRYEGEGKRPNVPPYKEEYFRDLISMTKRERQELVKELSTTKNNKAQWAEAWGVPGKLPIEYPTPCVMPPKQLDITLDCFAIPTKTTVGLPEKKGNTMYHDYDEGYEMNKEARAELHLQQRLYNMANAKENNFTKVFGLVDDVRPITPKDLIQRITDGKYIVASDMMEKEDCEPLRRFKWRDPSVKEDRVGWIDAMKNMNAAKTEVEDAIMVGTPTDALTALKAFESKTFH